MISIAPLTAEEFEARREASGISKADMCARAGIAVTTYSRWLAGRTEPSVRVYRRLAAVIETAERSATEHLLQGHTRYFVDGRAIHHIKE